jgi:hypothetical protein
VSIHIKFLLLLANIGIEKKKKKGKASTKKARATSLISPVFVWKYL